MKNQETNSLHSTHDAQKRKWCYEDDHFSAQNCSEKSYKRTSIISYDYENYQPNHQMTEQQHQQQHQQQQQQTMPPPSSIDIVNNKPPNQHLNDYELSDANIEYVNILYEDDLLVGVQAPIVTEQNYINFEPNWHNADILDLDQRNYCYEATIQDDGTVTMEIPEVQQQRPVEQQLHVEVQTNKNASAQKFYENANIAENPSLVTQSDDTEDKNLSWLFNYRLNQLPHLSPEVNRWCRTDTGLQVDKLIQEATSSEPEESNSVFENVVTETSPKVLKKPPFTYTELIEYALEDKGELTVSGIYNWISDRFPFYKSNDDRWKNSVRHNLSINPHFRKGNKAPQGAGHLWIISSHDSEANLLAWEHKKQRLELFFKMEKSLAQSSNDSPADVNNSLVNNFQDETSIAVANLTNLLDKPASMLETGTKSSIQDHSKSLGSCSFTTDDELKKSAGEILNGVKRTVEVQTVNPKNNSTLQESTILAYLEDRFPDYLNPVPKEQIVRESGLRSMRNNNHHNSQQAIGNNGMHVSSSNNEYGNDYFVNDLDPIELGININSNTETEDVLFGDEFNLNYFGIVPGSNIMA